MKYVENEAEIDALERYIVAGFGAKIAEEILRDAKRDCPVKTGRLERSLRRILFDRVWFIGSDVDYCRYVEDGTSRMAGRHFLRRALYKRRS